MFILFLLTCCGLMWLVRYLSYHLSSKTPPLYAGWLPFIGHVHLMFQCDPTKIWDFYKNISKYCMAKGGVIIFSLGPRPIYYVTDPEDAYTIANSSVDKNFTFKIAKPWLGNGLLTATDDIVDFSFSASELESMLTDLSTASLQIGLSPTWRAHRKVMNLAFTQRILDGLIPVFNKQAKRLMNEFESQKKTFNPEPLLLKNNLETICKTSLGLDADERQDLVNEYAASLRAIFGTMFERFVKSWLISDAVFYFSSVKKRQDKIINGLHNLSTTILENRKAEIKKLKENQFYADNFQPLLDPILEITLDKGLLTEKEMKEEIDTIIFGGHDTSATTLTYTLMLLGSDAARQEKAYQEILQIMGDSSRDVEKEDFPKLTYLECILKESLRLYPIAPAFPRVALKDIKLKNYTFPAGTNCMIDAWSVQRHSMWGPDANKFRPERWQDPLALPEFQKAFAGFGIGKRTCIGKPYATMSMKVILVHLLRTYKISADISELTLKMDSLLRPQSGHVITVERRK
ncbi:cytochrome P450 4V2-like [Anticarsia gemmatalis]|uniref:cytochrome P450 4V2-like n=1 Tax=Anticarsia gemmatalis TaxID=129554 RepID=UPI003F76E920